MNGSRFWLSLIAVFLLGILLRGQAPQLAPVASHVATPRFQIVINPNVRADTFLLDTETGRTWRTFEYSGLQEDPMIWRLQERMDSDADYFKWSAKQVIKKDK